MQPRRPYTRLPCPSGTTCEGRGSRCPGRTSTAPHPDSGPGQPTRNTIRGRYRDFPIRSVGHQTGSWPLAISFWSTSVGRGARRSQSPVIVPHIVTFRSFNHQVVSCEVRLYLSPERLAIETNQPAGVGQHEPGVGRGQEVEHHVSVAEIIVLFDRPRIVVGGAGTDFGLHE